MLCCCVCSNEGQVQLTKLSDLEKVKIFRSMLERVFQESEQDRQENMYEDIIEPPLDTNTNSYCNFRQGTPSSTVVMINRRKGGAGAKGDSWVGSDDNGYYSIQKRRQQHYMQARFNLMQLTI